jgi:hypothetical protein
MLEELTEGVLKAAATMVPAGRFYVTYPFYIQCILFYCAPLNSVTDLLFALTQSFDRVSQVKGLKRDISVCM